jgi:O-antigen/teichoic acid export membrane protein
LKNQLQQLFFGKLAKASYWIFSGAVAVGILGYFFQIMLGRMLSIEEYGHLNALLALLSILSAPLGALIMIITRRVSSYKAHSQIGHIGTYYTTIVPRILTAVILFLLVLALFSNNIQSYLKITDSAQFYLLSLLFFLLFIFSINNAFLYGLQKFQWVSSLGVFEVIAKILLSFFLVLMGLGIGGVLAGLIGAILLAIIVGYKLLSNEIVISKQTKNIAQRYEYRISTIAPILIANIAFIVMTQIDLLFVNYYFSPSEVGIYAAVAILGKSILFLPSSISKALFPMVAEEHAKGEGSYTYFKQSVIATLFMSIIGVLIFFFFGDKFLVILLGSNYEGTGVLLGFYGLAMMPLALVNLFEHYLIAKGRVVFAYLFFLVVPFQLLCIYFFHSSFLSILTVTGISGLLVLFFGIWFLKKELRKEVLLTNGIINSGKKTT